jgi:hypothetical protein
MNVRQARKALQHRIDDCLNCLKWKRFVRLHLASNLLTEIATVIEQGSRNRFEREVMVALKSALLAKNSGQLRDAGAAWSEIQSGDRFAESVLEEITTRDRFDNGVNSNA